MKSCSIEGCHEKHKGHGFCNKHYQRYKLHGNPIKLSTKKSCSIIDCKNKYLAKGFCNKHYLRYKTKKNTDDKIILDKCTFLNCNNKHEAKGYCSKHYMRKRKYGNASVVKYKNEYKSHENYFFDNFIINTENNCWDWIGPIRNGYGFMCVNGVVLSAHRFSYKHHYGIFDKSLFVCHKCDRPICCNPSHLFLGTHKDNMKDMLSKNRGRWKYKTNNKGV